MSFDILGKKQQQQLLLRELTNVRGRRMSSFESPSWWVHLLQQPRRKEGRKYLLRQVGFSTITSSSSSLHQQLRDKPSCCLGGDLVMVVWGHRRRPTQSSTFMKDRPVVVHHGKVPILSSFATLWEATLGFKGSYNNWICLGEKGDARSKLQAIKF